MRLFVALPLPESVRQQLLMLASGVKGAKWQRDDQLHLTLKFLGEVDGATAEDVDQALGNIAMEPFSVSLAGVGLFGTIKSPRVLWAGVEPETQVSRLYDKVERAMVSLGLAPEARKFSPHVTLARFRSGGRGNRNPHAQVGGLPGFLESHHGFRTPSFEVPAFALYSSHLGSEGALYRIELEYPLFS